MICHNCKNEIPDGCKFCGHCGAKSDNVQSGRKAPKIKKKADSDASYDIQNPYIPKKQTDPHMHFSEKLCTFQNQYDTSNPYLTEDRYAYQHTPGTRRYSTRLNRFSRGSNGTFSINDLSGKQLIAILSFFIALVVILVVVFTAVCSKPASPVGTWRSYSADTTITYVFRKDGSYSCTFEGMKNARHRGHYTYDSHDDTITFKEIIIGGTSPKTYSGTVEIRDSCIILNNLKYGRVCAEDENCKALNDILGTWHDTSYGSTTITFSKDGTYTINSPDTSANGIYIYDSSINKIDLPDCGISFSFLPKAKDGRQICWDSRELYFAKQ